MLKRISIVLLLFFLLSASSDLFASYDVTFNKTCTINSVFYEQAFSNLQKECIMEVKTDQTWSSKKANSDKVFLLCQRDIEKNNFILRNVVLPYDNRPFWLRVPINDGFDGSGKNKGKAKYYDCKYRHDFAICDQRSMLVVRPAIRIPIK